MEYSDAAYLEVLDQMPAPERRRRQVRTEREVQSLANLQHWVIEGIYALRIDPGKRVRGLTGTPAESRTMLADALEERLTRVNTELDSMIDELRGAGA